MIVCSRLSPAAAPVTYSAAIIHSLVKRPGLHPPQMKDRTIKSFPQLKSFGHQRQGSDRKSIAPRLENKASWLSAGGTDDVAVRRVRALGPWRELANKWG